MSRLFSAAALFALALPTLAQASVSLSAFSNDATTVSYQVTYSGTRTVHQLYLDTDRSKSTGFLFNSGGTDFLLSAAQLLQFSGAPGSYDWTWTPVAQVSYVNNDNGDGTFTDTWVIARSLLGSPASLDVSAKVYGGGTAEEITGRFTQNMSTNYPVLARDPLKQPFASSSIWNRSIGTGASYVPANLPGNPGPNTWTPMPQIDTELIVLTPNAPLQDVRYSSVGWQTGMDRCVASATWPTQYPNGLVARLPMPDDFIVANSRGNNSSAVLMADKRTLVQVQPLTRCVAASYATSIIAFAPVDLYGPGITGAHGGSGLSAFGGSIRLGELVPGSTQGPRHALKFNLDASQFLYRCGYDPTNTKTDAEKKLDCFRWPASKADSYALTNYGTVGPTVNYAMRMGALLAIPQTVDLSTLGLLSDIGKQIAWTLQNYGAYIVDDTAGPGYAFAAEISPTDSVTAQVERDFHTPFGVRINDNTPWAHDLQILVQYLHVVDNNTRATGPAGGGTPLQPPLPELPAM